MGALNKVLVGAVLVVVLIVTVGYYFISTTSEEVAGLPTIIEVTEDSSAELLIDGKNYRLSLLDPPGGVVGGEYYFTIRSGGEKTTEGIKEGSVEYFHDLKFEFLDYSDDGYFIRVSRVSEEEPESELENEEEPGVAPSANLSAEDDLVDGNSIIIAHEGGDDLASNKTEVAFGKGRDATVTSDDYKSITDLASTIIGDYLEAGESFEVDDTDYSYIAAGNWVHIVIRDTGSGTKLLDKNVNVKGEPGVAPSANLSAEDDPGNSDSIIVSHEAGDDLDADKTEIAVTGGRDAPISSGDYEKLSTYIDEDYFEAGESFVVSTSDIDETIAPGWYHVVIRHTASGSKLLDKNVSVR